MKASIRSDYYAAAGEFTTKEESRYSLRSIRIEPHPDKGVVVVGTDGHTLCVFHDLGGSVEGDGLTLRFKEDFAALCYVERVLQVNDDGSASLCEGFEPNETVRFTGMVDDGKFPTWRAVLPSKRGDRSDYNPEYLQRCARFSDSPGPNVIIWSGSDGSQVTHGEDRPAVVCVREREDCFFLVMPMRQTEVEYPQKLIDALRPKGLADIETKEPTDDAQ